MQYFITINYKIQLQVIFVIDLDDDVRWRNQNYS